MNIARIKLIAAAVLLACLALPEYTCSKFIGPDGKEIAATGPSDVPATPYTVIHEKHYPLESFDARDFATWLKLLAYSWPLPIIVYWFRKAKERGALDRWVLVAEPLLSIGSGYLVWLSSSVGTRAAGAYLAMAANGAYLCAWAAELRARRRT